MFEPEYKAVASKRLGRQVHATTNTYEATEEAFYAGLEGARN
jgi:hypothetical protein